MDMESRQVFFLFELLNCDYLSRQFIIVFIRIMFRLNILTIFSLSGLNILNVSKAHSAKIKELDLASLRDSDSFNFYASLRQERLQNYQNGSLEYR